MLEVMGSSPLCKAKLKISVFLSTIILASRNVAIINKCLVMSIASKGQTLSIT